MTSIDDYTEDIIQISHIISDKKRLSIILFLLEKKASVNEIVESLKIDQPRVSTHINLLFESNFVSVETVGRQRFYDIKNKSWMKNLLSIMTQRNSSTNSVEFPKRSREAEKLVQQNSPIRQARTCYDHLAGVSGVHLLDILLNNNYLEIKKIKNRPDYVLTSKGKEFFTKLGIEFNEPLKKTRKFAYGCPDWTERRYHLGGYLGLQILDYLESEEIIKHDKKTRIVFLNKPIDSIFA